MAASQKWIARAADILEDRVSTGRAMLMLDELEALEEGNDSVVKTVVALRNELARRVAAREA